MPKQGKGSFLKRIKAAEPTASFILGLIVVLSIGGLAGHYLYQQYYQKPAGQLPSKASKKIVSSQTTKTNSHQYRVKSGDYLWKIAEHFYQSGYNWVDIARANKLANPDLLEIGMVLTIPNIRPKASTIIAKARPTIPTQQTRYTIQKGDSLSLIALRAYGDMFAWPRLWKANRDKIANPWLIYPGQVIIIRRP